MVIVAGGEHDDLAALDAQAAATVEYVSQVHAAYPAAKIVLVTPFSSISRKVDGLQALRGALTFTAFGSKAALIDPLGAGWINSENSLQYVAVADGALTPSGQTYVAGRLVSALRAAHRRRVTVVWLPDETWSAIQSSVPIVCVDLFPVQLDAAGAVSAVGLIRRTMPGSEDLVWCPIGGRISHGETLRAAVLRHLESTLIGAAFDLSADPQPSYVFQWFPTPRHDDGVAYGMDPRRHSVGLCFVVPVAGDPVAIEGGEALDFAWFDAVQVDQLPMVAWPGTAHVVRALRLFNRASGATLRL